MSRFSATVGRPVEGAVAHAAPAARLAFLRKVYGLFLVGLGVAGVGGYVGTRPQVVETLMSNGLLLIIGYLAAFFVCQWLRKEFPLNIALFGLFTFISGLVLAPLLAVYALGGPEGVAVLGQALGITGCIFCGLTVYTLTSRSDFSYLRGALIIGLFAFFGLMIVQWFVPFSSNMELLFAVGGVILFSGFILYHTSSILHHYRTDEYVAGALALYIDFILLFRYVLMLLGRRD